MTTKQSVAEKGGPCATGVCDIRTLSFGCCCVGHGRTRSSLSCRCLLNSDPSTCVGGRESMRAGNKKRSGKPYVGTRSKHQQRRGGGNQPTTTKRQQTVWFGIRSFCLRGVALRVSCARLLLFVVGARSGWGGGWEGSTHPSTKKRRDETGGHGTSPWNALSCTLCRELRCDDMPRVLWTNGRR